MSSPLEFRSFTIDEYAEYKSWYEDEQIKRTLGHIDQEWLDYILHDEGGMQFAVLHVDKLVAVVGISCPSDRELFYVITDIAIHPALRRQGLGSKVLSGLYDAVELKPGQYWVSYVERFNVAAQRFFERNGWVRGEEEDMVRYEYR